MGWSFAIINGRLAEIFFDKKKGKPIFLGHCYVKSSEYKTKIENKYIRYDTKKNRFTYKNKKYISQLTGKTELSGPFGGRFQ